MDEEIVYDKFYRGRELIIKHMSTQFINYFCGYIALKDKDLRVIGNPRNEESLIFDRVFDYFYGEPTFLGELFGNDTIYVGFDTAHAGMETVTKEDCIKALKNTVDLLAIEAR